MITINLAAKRVSKEHKFIRKQAISFFLAVGAGFLMSLLWWSGVSAMSSSVKEKHAVAKAEQRRLIIAKAKNIKFLKQKKRRKAILATIKKLEVKREGPRPMLDYINVVLPMDIWLRRVDERDNALKITGYTFSAQAVADLMRSLSSNKIFASVALKEIQRKLIKGQELSSFTITAQWKRPGTEKPKPKLGADGKPLPASKGNK